MYRFSYKTGAADLWQMSMYYTYSSFLGVINVVFTAALIALTVSAWNNTHIVLRIPLILASCWFIVFQPIIVFRKAKKRAELIEYTTELTFTDSGMHIAIEDKSQDMTWDKISKYAKLPTMIIVFTDAAHGYVLNNKTLGDKKNEFIKFLDSKIGK